MEKINDTIDLDELIDPQVLKIAEHITQDLKQRGYKIFLPQPEFGESMTALVFDIILPESDETDGNAK